MKEKTLLQFFEVLNSDNPTPGGGAVTSYVASLALGLSNMAILISKRRKSFLSLDEEIKEKINEASNNLTKLGNELLDEIQNDIDAFNNYMLAFKMPKDSNEEIKLRDEKLKEASISNINSPYRVLEIILEAYKQYEIIAPYVVKSIISDLAIGLILLDSGIQSSIVNLKINLPYIEDKDIIKKVNDIIKVGKKLKEQKLFKLLTHTMSLLEEGN